MDRLVGFGFKPSNEDIIDLLKEKRHDPDFSVHAIREIDFYKFEPWELPGLSAIQSKEDVWWFFHKPYAKAYRRTKTGYWKENGRGSNMKAKNGRDVIGKKRTLTFLSRSNDSKKAIIKWVMHEIAVKDDPLYYKENFVVCRLERKRDTRHDISTNGEDQSSRNLADDLINSPMTFQNESSREEPGQTNAPDFNSSKSDGYSREATQETISYSRNHIAEIASPKSQQLLSHNSISYNRNHVAESSSIELLSVPNDNWESLKLPNQLSVSYSTSFVDISFEAEPRLHAEFNPHGGYNGLSNAYFSALQSPIHPPEKELSYSNGSSYGCDLLNSQFCSGQVDDLINSSRAFQSESSLEEPGQTYASDFNSSKSDEYSREATGQTISYSRNNVTEIASLESQQLLHHNSISCYGNHVAENSSIELLSVPNDILESLKLPNQHSVSYSTNFVDNSFEVEPQLHAEFNQNGGYNGLSNAYFSALQSPIHPEQVDELINSLRASQNESSREEPGQTFTPDFNSSKSDECSREATGKPFSPGFNSSQSDEEFMQNGSEMGH